MPEVVPQNMYSIVVYHDINKDVKSQDILLCQDPSTSHCTWYLHKSILSSSGD